MIRFHAVALVSPARVQSVPLTTQNKSSRSSTLSRSARITGVGSANFVLSSADRGRSRHMGHGRCASAYVRSWQQSRQSTPLSFRRGHTGRLGQQPGIVPPVRILGTRSVARRACRSGRRKRSRRRRACCHFSATLPAKKRAIVSIQVVVHRQGLSLHRGPGMFRSPLLGRFPPRLGPWFAGAIFCPSARYFAIIVLILEAGIHPSRGSEHLCFLEYPETTRSESRLGRQCSCSNWDL